MSLSMQTNNAIRLVLIAQSWVGQSDGQKQLTTQKMMSLAAEQDINLDYKTAQKFLEMLCENNVLVKNARKNSAALFYTKGGAA